MSAQKAPVLQPASPPQDDPFPEWTQSPPLENSSRGFANKSLPKRAKKNSFNARTLIVPAVITSVVIGGVGLVLVGIMWGKQFLPAGTPASDLSTVFSESIFASDSRSSVAADLQALRTQVEAIGRSIPSGDQSEASAKRLLAEVPKFEALFRRACKLPIKVESLADFANEQTKAREALQRLRTEMPNGPPANLPFEATFWSINTAAKPDDLVVHAINEVTQSSHSVYTIMSQALIDFPDPLTYQGPEFDWSAEDRRVLAIIRLQGAIERDALQALAAIDPKAPSQSDLNKVHLHLDKAIETAKQLSGIPGKSVGGMLAFVPKGNPYEPQQISAMVALNNLRKLMEAEATLPAEVKFLFDEAKSVSELIANLLYRSGTSSITTYLATAPTSSERFQASLLAEEKKKADALQAEKDQQEEQQKQLAEAKLRQEKAAADQLKREADRKQALDERLADASAGKTGGPIGVRGPGGLGENIGPRGGPRGGQIGMPTGPDGNPVGSMGSGQQPGQPPNFPGFGAGQPGMRQDRLPPNFPPQGPPVPQGDPAKQVTISCEKVKNQDSSAYVRDLPKWILSYAPSIAVSNGNLKITIQNYDKPLADLASCFPSLVFEEVDAQSRTIIAKEK